MSLINFFGAASHRRTYVIAEIGVNHNGSLDLAKRLILDAKEAGADGAKFQTFNAAALVSHGTPRVKYQIKSDQRQISHFEMLRQLELSPQAHVILKSYCDEIGIDFLSTPYDERAVNLLVQLGVKFIKTASADLIDIRIHSAISKYKIPAVISVGMATIEEISRTLDIYRGLDKSNIVLMHCTSNYPATNSSLNLHVIPNLRSTFGTLVGYSDHSQSEIVAPLAVGLGASVVERHITLDKSMVGPDHLASFTKVEFRKMVQQIREAEEVLGSGTKEIQDEEREMRRISRKSITISRRLEAGHIIREGDLVLKRPGTGISPFELPTLIGKRTLVALEADYQPTYDDLV